MVNLEKNSNFDLTFFKIFFLRSFIISNIILIFNKFNFLICRCIQQFVSVFCHRAREENESEVGKVGSTSLNTLTHIAQSSSMTVIPKPAYIMDCLDFIFLTLHIFGNGVLRKTNIFLLKVFFMFVEDVFMWTVKIHC